MTEDYVSFEIAKLLKEKGFDEHCFCINYPLPEGEHHNIILPNLLNNSMIPFTDEYKFCRYKEDFITIPTTQMAMKWLREVHNIHIEIARGPKAYHITIVTIPHGVVKYITRDIVGTTCVDSYEEACETSLKYCLKNLI